MELISKVEFDFKFMQGQFEEENGNEQDVMNGDFQIIENGEVVGVLYVSNYSGERYVSAETPDANFTIDEWIAFVSKVKERFKLDGTQSFMMNKYPQSFAM